MKKCHYNLFQINNNNNNNNNKWIMNKKINK